MNGQAQRLEGASYDQVHPLVSECCGCVIRSVSQLVRVRFSESNPHRATVKLVQANEWTWYQRRGGWSSATGLWLSPCKVTELGVHSLGLALLRVRFSGLKLLKQVQLMLTGPSPGIVSVDRTATCPLQTIRSLHRLG